MPDIQHKRGSRSALDALAGSSGLLTGQIYVITDENRLAVALSASTYETYVKESEIGTAAARNLHVGTTAPGSPSTGDLWVDTN